MYSRLHVRGSSTRIIHHLHFLNLRNLFCFLDIFIKILVNTTSFLRSRDSNEFLRRTKHGSNFLNPPSSSFNDRSCSVSNARLVDSLASNTAGARRRSAADSSNRSLFLRFDGFGPLVEGISNLFIEIVEDGSIFLIRKLFLHF